MPVTPSSFGSSVGGAGTANAIFDPVGPETAAGTVFESMVAIGFGGARTYLTSADLGAVPTTDAPTTSNSFFVFGDLQFSVIQALTPLTDAGGARTGSMLSQAYFITNLGATTATFDLVRYIDGDLGFDGSIVDGGGRFIVNGNVVMFELDGSRAAGDVSTLVAITATGGVVDDANRYEADQYSDLRTNIENGAALDNTIFGDTNANGFSNSLYDVTMALRNVYTIAPGESSFYFTTTLFGTLSPDAFELPELSSISGFKWEDRNGDGVRQVGEPFLSDWQIYLDLNGNGTLDIGEPEQLTDNSGAYTFDELFPGHYEVREVPQTDWIQTFPATGFHEVDLEFDERVVDLDFGNVLPRISGLKFHDLNGDGNRQFNEPTLGGWEIYLDINDNGVFDAGTDRSTTTGAGGRYEFTGLTSGRYVIREELRSGWRQLKPGSGSYVVNYTAGTVVDSRDFGNQKLAGISGIKWHDLNENGKRNAGEPGLAGWTIYLDLDADGVLDAGEPFDVTASDGSYTIGAILPVNYRVTEVAQANWEQTFPGGDGVHIVDLLGGKSLVNVDFGNKGFASVSGVKYNDLNKNGTREAGEAGLAGFYIYIDSDGDSVPGIGERGTYSDADGMFTIARIEPGSYELREDVPPGWELSAPAAEKYDIALAAGDSAAGYDFGNYSQLDWGDAPAPYPTLSAADGARHGIVAGFHLGPGAAGVVMVDAEPDGQPSPTAIGDDAGDDADGIVGPWSITSGAVNTLTVIGSPAQDVVKGKLQGWVDFNGDRNWDGPGEQIFKNVIISSGPNALTYTAPAIDAGSVAGPSFARLRISYEFGLGYDGYTLAGEVEDYMVTINSDFGANATDLGVVGNVALSDVSFTGPTALYETVAQVDGIYRARANFQHAQGNIDLLVFDAAGNVLHRAERVKNNEKIEFSSTAGETYYVGVFGANPNVDLAIQNMVAIDSPPTIVGTEGDDVFTLVLRNSTHILRVNGEAYKFDSATTKKFTFEGNGGKDSLKVTATDGRDRATFHPGELTLTGPGYEVNASAVESIRLYGKGGGDKAWFHDSAENDRFVAKPTYSYMQDADRTYYNYANGVSRAYAFATVGNDRADLYGSNGDDRFVAKPTHSFMNDTGLTYYNRATGFDRTYGIAVAGGNDIATVYDGMGDDRIFGRNSMFYLSALDYYYYGRGFNAVSARGTAGGTNTQDVSAVDYAFSSTGTWV